MSFLMSSKLRMQNWTALKGREFDELVIETGGDGHLYHSGVWWIYRERIMERVRNLRQEFLVWFNRREDHKALFFRYLFWLAGLVILVTYLTTAETHSLKLWNWHIRSDFQNHIFKHVVQNFEEEIYNNNLMSLKTLQTFHHVHV